MCMAASFGFFCYFRAAGEKSQEKRSGNSAALKIYGKKSEIDLLDAADVRVVQNIAALTEDLGEGSEEVHHFEFGSFHLV